MPDNSGGDNQDKQIIPTNLVFNVELTGQNDENPFGDGSGKIKLSASAVNAVNYSFRFGTGDVTESNTGIVEFIYSDFGTKSYTVNVLAYSSTGDYVSSEIYSFKWNIGENFPGPNNISPVFCRQERHPVYCILHKLLSR